MNRYYNNNYSHCTPQTSSFSSSNYVSTSVHLVTALSIPLSIYGSYCVIKITPRQLKGAKWALLNVHIWTIVLDIVFNVLSIPFMFFPAVSGVMLGWGQYIGIPSWFLLYSIQALVSVYASAAIGLLENRQNAIHTKWKIKRKWVRILINAINYNVACVTVIPPYLESFDIESMALQILEVVPCPVPEFFDPRLFFVTNKPFLVTMLMATQSMILIPQGIFYFLHTWYHLVYAHSSQVSAETRKMQFRFLIGSLSQMTIPTAVFMNPIVYIWFSVNTGYYNQEINNHLVFIVSFHGLLSTSCMILVHRHYRNHFIKIITFGRVRRDRPKPISVLVSSVRSVGHNN